MSRIIFVKNFVKSLLNCVDELVINNAIHVHVHVVLWIVCSAVARATRVRFHSCPELYSLMDLREQNNHKTLLVFGFK